ncbi:MAG: hypothetical protein JJE36_04290 [Coriobacteriia bacterium]|nr:hypothetical protein [Coriobacteriia bacterium]
MRWTKARKRVVLEIAIVFMVVAAILLVFFIVRKPGVAGSGWINPNKYSSSALIETPKKFNGKVIEFTGEAVGERMVRNAGQGMKGAWIHLNDDAYMTRGVEAGGGFNGYNSGMAIWVEPASLTKAIEHYGRYKQNGDIVRITGTFNAACAEHGGDMDIHATKIEIVQSGKTITHKVYAWKLISAIFLVMLALAMLAINRRRFLKEQLAVFMNR